MHEPEAVFLYYQLSLNVIICGIPLRTTNSLRIVATEHHHNLLLKYHWHKNNKLPHFLKKKKKKKKKHTKTQTVCALMFREMDIDILRRKSFGARSVSRLYRFWPISCGEITPQLQPTAGFLHIWLSAHHPETISCRHELTKSVWLSAKQRGENEFHFCYRVNADSDPE